MQPLKAVLEVLCRHDVVVVLDGDLEEDLNLLQSGTRSQKQGTRKQKPRLFFETEKQRFLFVFVEAAEGKQEGLWEGSGHSGQGAVGGHAGTRHE